MNSVPSLLRKARNFGDKMLWGGRVVGARAAARGAMRIGYLYVRRPSRSEIRLRSGQILEFAFPSQVPRALLAFGDFIDPEFALLRKIYHPGWIVADVGAAIGQFAIFAATLPAAKVHAFEPSSANVAALSRNILRNGVSDRVEVHRLAFSNAESEAYFETTASTWLSGISETGTELVSVRKLTDDFQRRGLDHVSILKINVAGFEPQVIEGADVFLAKGGADILILLLGLASLPWYAKLATYGYRFFYFHPIENVLYEVTAFDADSVLAHRPWPARNIIAIHQAAVEPILGTRFPVRGI
ncbi:FkbM family methyltransferase [Rhizobium herbae]|uniref:FkbM family methyltransferase n=1 Tax=Rhizobium herbae TaxID=508661 RepID=A0ABS4EWI9_9HYPH|nr:FkbM family methyltransferase [Rhizobium herbae]MBP1862314.1 FkbM family methyltransferase [Rhizobium herbae]